METFTHSVSHDLKAPLRGIDGYGRLLLEEAWSLLSDDGRIFLGNIRQATAQMSQLIDDLLSYSRLERRDIHAAAVELPEMVNTLLGERAAEIQRRGVTIEVGSLCPTLCADKDGLALSLRNLLDNALKFTEQTPHPRIEIGGRSEEESYILWVRDNGVGFDMQFHDRLFEIFQRLHQAEDYPGTGIGLAIVRKAVERMNGRVWAESGQGVETTFFLELPEQP